MGAALHRVLTDPEQRDRMAAEAARLAPALLWSTVADRYRTLVADLLASRTPVAG
jgi:glycosyltransferase involved in cell wall biosynthesis